VGEASERIQDHLDPQNDTRTKLVTVALCSSISYLISIALRVLPCIGFLLGSDAGSILSSTDLYLSIVRRELIAVRDRVDAVIILLDEAGPGDAL
jgi:hypothetical protein